MKKKIAISLLILGIVSFGLYISTGSRFKKTNILNLENEKKDNSSPIENEDGDFNEKDTPETAPDIEIEPADCDNNCSEFQKDDEKEYCRVVCGTESFFEDANSPGGSIEDCDEETGIQKDYCLKDIAVGNKDFETCSEIIDTKVKKSCQNRIMEDIMEEQNNQEDFEM